MCLLDQKYATPLDVLRRIDFPDFRTGPGLNIDDPNMEILAGILGKGYFSKKDNFLHRLQEGIKRHGKVVDKLIGFAPAVAKQLAKRIPVVANHADQIQHGLQKVIDHHMARKHQQMTDQGQISGTDIAMMQRS